MFEEQIQNIRENTCSSFDELILQRYDSLNSNGWGISEDEQILLEGFLRIREAMNIHLQNGTDNVSQEIRDTLAEFNLEVDTFVCSLQDEEVDSEVLILQEIPTEARGILESAISWLFWSSFISEVFWWSEQEQAFVLRYSELISWFSDNDFMFSMPQSQVNIAHQFLRENRINRLYNPNDRRSNYILWIVNREIEERWIEITIIPSFERNLTARVIPILDQFDEQWLYPQIEDFPEADEIISDGGFVLMDSELWTLDNSIVSKSWRNGQEWLVYAHSSVLALMHVIMNRLSDQGIDYIPNIWSLLRPISYNRDLPGSSDNSPHIRWLWIDFDLGNDDLEDILKELDVAWYIVLTIESDHYHVTVINPEWLQSDFPDIIPEEIEESDMNREYLRSLFWEDFNWQLGTELSILLLDTLWVNIQENPMNHIDSEWRISWNNTFLQDLFQDFINILHEDQKQILVENNSTMDINIFFRVSSWALRRWSRRIYFREIISPIEYPESDEFSSEIETERTISDREFLSFSSDIIMQELFWENTFIDQVDIWTIETNITEFYRFFMHMESDFRNVCNTDSSACWFHQILGWVIWWIENTSLYNTSEWRYTSFQEYLNRVNRLLSSTTNSNDYIYRDSFDLHRNAALDSNLYSPQSLTWSEQSFLVLWSLLHKARSNSSLRFQLQRIFLFGDVDALWSIYADYHHTDRSHRATWSRLNSILPGYEEHLSSPEPSVEFMQFSVELQLDILIWNPSESEDTISWHRAQFLQIFLLMLWYEISNLEFAGNMVNSFGPSTKRALIQFQIDNNLIGSEEDASAWLFWPGTKRILRDKVTQWIESISEYTDNFIWPPVSPGLRASDIIEVFSR